MYLQNSILTDDFTLWRYIILHRNEGEELLLSLTEKQIKFSNGTTNWLTIYELERAYKTSSLYKIPMHRKIAKLNIIEHNISLLFNDFIQHLI